MLIYVSGISIFVFNKNYYAQQRLVTHPFIIPGLPPPSVLHCEWWFLARGLPIILFVAGKARLQPLAPLLLAIATAAAAAATATDNGSHDGSG